MSERLRCLAKTNRKGLLCQNYRDTCPVKKHRRQHAAASGQAADTESAVSDSAEAEAEAAVDWDPLTVGTQPVSLPPRPLADDPAKLSRAVEDTAFHYGLRRNMILRDYQLVQALYEWVAATGGKLYRTHSQAGIDEQRTIGRTVFAGGTSLSAAWGVTERWSEDIDMVVSAMFYAKRKHLVQACKAAFGVVARSQGGTYRVTEKSQQFLFATLSNRATGQQTRIDLVHESLDPCPVWTQRVPVMSLIGRASNPDDLHMHPELGGFEIETLGPGSTAMSKLLAQTEASESGNLERIAYRARDIYDLACIARARDRFEGHLGRDSKALLHIAESWIGPQERRRPPEGFASLKSFDPSTPEHEALAKGYETVMNNMVWGQPIPLDEAIALAVTLDPGPAEPYDATTSYSHVATP